jgi:hypothetical protein
MNYLLPSPSLPESRICRKYVSVPCSLLLASHLVSSRTFRSRPRSTAPRLSRPGQWNLWTREQMPPSTTSTNMPGRDRSGRRQRPLTKTGTIV